MSDSSHPLEEKLRSYKQRYFLQRLLRGLLFWVSSCGAVFLLLIVLESQFWLSSLGRGILHFSFLLMGLGMGYFWVMRPLWRLFFSHRSLSDESASRYIGDRLPEVRDQLLNYIQLRSYEQQSVLARSSLAQKQLRLQGISFFSAISWQRSYRYLRYFLGISGAFLVIWFVDAQFIKQSSERLYHYDRAYAIPAPFRFAINEQSLYAYLDEPFDLKLELVGKQIPEEVYLVNEGRYIRMQAGGEGGHFFYRFESLHTDLPFRFEADGYSSLPYVIRSLERPSLLEASVELNFPSYTQIPHQALDQLKSLSLPEGTRLKWSLSARSTDRILLYFSPTDSLGMQKIDSDTFHASHRFSESGSYEIRLENAHSSNKTPLRYRIDVQKDQLPTLYSKVFADTLLYSLVALSGYATDDYGISSLRIQYRLEKQAYKYIPIPFSQKSQQRVSFYMEWLLDSLSLKEGQLLSYRIQALDNDLIHGSKAVSSPWYYFQLPHQSRIHDQVSRDGQRSADQMQQSYNQKQALESQIHQLQEQLKVKKELGWPEQQQLKALIEQREDIIEQIEELKTQQLLFEEKTQRFDTLSDEMQQKMDQIHQLLSDVLDPETQKLYEELQKLMQEKSSLPVVQKMLDRISQEERLQSNNLDRALSLMKRLSYDLQVKQIEQELESLSESQKSLRQESTSDQSSESLAQRQKELQDSFKEIEKKIEKAKRMHQELNLPASFPDIEVEQHIIKGQQKESLRLLDQDQQKKSQAHQKKAEEMLQQMKQKLESAQQQLHALEVEIDIERMYKILDNLIWLSIQEEALEQSMGNDLSSYVQQDQVARTQFDIQKGSEATIDSLEAFAKRNSMISANLQKEIQSLRTQLEESMHAMREREPVKARSKQRYATITFNKLALFVSELLERLEASQSSGGQGDGQQSISLPQLQQQLLEQIQQIKKSGKQGEPLSEELARIIAEQEMIRRQLEEIEGRQKKGTSQKNQLQQLIEEMKKSEHKLSRKELSEELIKSQQKIKTRLLNFEKASQEDKKDPQRKSERPKAYDQIIPPELKLSPHPKEEHLEIDRLPLPLNTYYEREVRKYFKRLEESPSL